jgi:tetratricopeptide (TPR) repeat protein
VGAVNANAGTRIGLASQDKFEQALAFHRQGSTAEAERLYLEVIDSDPRHFDALHLLGVIFLQTGRPGKGVEMLEKALAINPEVAAAHTNLGTALNDLGRRVEAVASYDRAIVLKPDQAETHNNRGNVLKELRRLEDALAGYDRAIALKPDFAEAHTNRGAILFELNRLEEAVESHDRAIALKPDFAEAYFNRGNALYTLKRLEEAVASFDAAIARKPDFAAAHSNRGIALYDLGHLDEALAGYEKAITLKPDYAEAHSNRGIVLFDLERFDEALASYDRAIAARPGYAEAYANRGNAFKDLERFDEALASYDRAIAFKPDYAVAHNNRAMVLQDRKRLVEALASYDNAIAAKPDYAEAYNNRGVVLYGLGRLGEALTSYAKATALKPEYAEAQSNQGNVLCDLGRVQEAIACYDLAIVEKPDYAAAHSNRANALKELRRFDEALASYDKAIALDPDYADARVNRSLCVLLLGRLQEAWPEYEWRKENGDWRTGRPCPAVPYRAWRSDKEIAGKTVLVGAEQGLGDGLQFCRYLKVLEQKGARVVLVVQGKLCSILRTLSPTLEVVALGGTAPVADYHCALLSLPMAFGTTLENIPAEVPYLRAEPERVERWRQRLGGEGFRIGIAWQGRPGRVDTGRSFALRELEEIGRLPGVRLISLQKNFGSEQLARLPAGMKVETLGEGYDIGPDAFLDTAAVMESLDLVITSDTAIAHLAGALGRPVWVALKWVPDWRWLLGRADSPWYPTMRLFRQPSRGDWTGAFRAMRDELAVRTGAGGAPGVTATDARYHEALALHRQGKFTEAADLCEDTLASEPDHFDTLHLAGVNCLRTGHAKRAVEFLSKALAINPEAEIVHNNLGTGLKDLGKLDAALASYDRALALSPDYADAHSNRGIALFDLNRPEEALASCDKAIALRPDFASAHANRANALYVLNRLDEAVASYDKAIELNPGLVEAYSNRGNALYGLRRLDEALASYNKAIALKPDYAAAYNNRGILLHERKRSGEALENSDKAIALSPDYAEAYSTRGAALKDLALFDDALASYDRAIALKPDYAEAYCNRGGALKELRRLDEALASYDKAIALRADHADAHWNKSLCLLLLGRFERGWPEYEWRKEGREWRAGWLCPSVPYRAWRSDEDIAGKTVLVSAEQGLGDTLQFCRYLKLLETRGARVVVAVQAGLRAIVSTLSPSIEVLVPGEAVPAADYHCPLLSLPLAFGTMLESIPAEVPYLQAQPERIERWRQRIGSEGFRIGIAWQGRIGKVDAGRSFAVTALEEIGRLDGVRLISLQKNFGSEQLARLPAGMKVETLGEDYDAGPEAFLDTAAVMESLDLVITPDTAIAHLAGALGRPVWVALKWVPDWRWLLDRSDSPWYPTMRLFRQAARGDWTGVFGAIRDELAGRTGTGGMVRTAVASTQGGSLQQVQARLAHALALHQAGELQGAQAIYREILKVQPDHFDSLHLSGVIACQTGDLELGVRLIGGAVRVNPDVASAYYNRANALLKLKRAEEALENLDKALSLQPDYPEAHFSRGNALMDLKRQEEALASYNKALSQRPDYVAAYNNRGNALRELKRLDEAVASFDSAVALNPDYVEAHCSRGNALRDLKRFEEAVASYDKALSLKPDLAETYFNRGNAQLELKRLEDAVASYNSALSLKSDLTEAYNNRGNALLELKRFEQAVASYDGAVSLNPGLAEAHNNRGKALVELKRLEDAVASYDRALLLKPDLAMAYISRASVLMELKRFEEAVSSYDKALLLKPDLAEAYNNRGNALAELTRLGEALASYDRGLSLKPDLATIHNNRANVLLALRRPYEALASYERALSLEPDYPFLFGTCLYTRMMVCDWGSLSDSLTACATDIEARKRVTPPFPALVALDASELHKIASEIYVEAIYPRSHVLGPTEKRSPDGKIRVGYYSADFRNHAISYLVAELLEAHDVDRFELYGFSYGPGAQDDMRKRVTAAFSKFIDVRDKSDREVARLSRTLGIDIAVDLTGHTQSGRPGIFAEGCAPVQVNWLGYPGTMGADYINYIIADKIVIPEENQRSFTEKVVYLPNSYQVNDSKRKISDRVFTRQELGLPESGFVFCCFNNNQKILPKTYDGWMRVLKAVNGSVLWLLEDNPSVAMNLRKEAEARGVNGNRLVFAHRMPLDEHLARHRMADLFLDTLPYNAHTTASDALWVGLPVLTCMGRSFAGRVAASLLKTVGLPELVTDTQEAYEAKAIYLAGNSAVLRQLRDRLVANRATTSLFDGRLFARHIEAAYEVMHARCQAGIPADVIEVQP